MRKVFDSINSRILLIPMIALMALIVAGLVSIRTIANVTLREHQARARAVTDAATTIVEYYEAKAAQGEMPEQGAQEAAKEVLRAIRYDDNEYVVARRRDGLIEVNGLFRNREGTPSLDSKDSNGTLFSADMIKAAEAGKATEEIQATVAAIQSMTASAVSAIQGIGGIVARMNEITGAVAAAAEEQGAATGEIAGNIQQAATSAKQVSGSVTTAQTAASETGAIADNVLAAAGRLSLEAERLKSEVADFLAQVRAA